jgi:vacuolar-type H+-ATPase subunit B/Vma2
MDAIFDDYYLFRKEFEEAGRFSRRVTFVNQAPDPVVERLLNPDLALAVAENIAVDEWKRVLVLLSDMTAFADALTVLRVNHDPAGHRVRECKALRLEDIGGKQGRQAGYRRTFRW